MTPAESWPEALALTIVMAIVARVARAVSTSGAVAGLLVGGGVAVGYGLPGLAVLGAFFVTGSVATKVGWAKKTERGTDEAGGGARGGGRVVGKGGIAALVAVLAATGLGESGDAGNLLLAVAFCGALAAALGDTLGTEIGTLARGLPRSFPTFRPVPPGTPGAVSAAGTLATAGGAGFIAAVAAVAGLIPWEATPGAALAGFGAAMLESLVTSLFPSIRKTPGWVRNLLTTGAGAGLGLLLAGATR